MGTPIDQILPKRSDLSTFLVHLTKRTGTRQAKDNLCRIITNKRLNATSTFGQAFKKMQDAGWNTDSQKCVCFTEVPLQHICLLTEQIEGRAVVLEPYGIAVAKKFARFKDVNPIWYLDQTKGRNWLTNHWNKLIDEAIEKDDKQNSILKLTPFIEQFGDYKDFHWEREWRCSGDFYLPDRYLVIAPERDHRELMEHIAKDADPVEIKIIDSKWSMETTIARLAGFEGHEL